MLVFVDSERAYMNLTEGKDRGGRDYWTAGVCMNYPAERDFHVVVEVVGTGKVAVVVQKHWFYRR